jgi:phage terminase large subunit-like protein
VEVSLGTIPACKYVTGACNRYLNDLVKDSNGWDYSFKVKRAERYLRLVQKFEHVIGNWKPKTIIYSPWQKFCFMNIKG